MSKKQQPDTSKAEQLSDSAPIAPDTTPTVLNGIVDPDAAEAMAPTAAEIKEAEKTAKAAKNKGKNAKKPKQKRVKVAHPKAKMTFRHNVLPPLMGILCFAGVLGLLNNQWLIAQSSYYFSAPVKSVTVTEQPENSNENAPARIYIPRINVDAPIITNEKSYDPAKVQTSLQNGVLQYGASVDPGVGGLVVVVGHSSGQLWAPGDYKFVFTNLDKLQKDDRIAIDFKGKRYIYRISERQIVDPSYTSVLQPTSFEPTLKLITCTPVGTSKDRLVITATQIYPDPSTATPMKENQAHPITNPVIPY